MDTPTLINAPPDTPRVGTDGGASAGAVAAVGGSSGGAGGPGGNFVAGNGFDGHVVPVTSIYSMDYPWGDRLLHDLVDTLGELRSLTVINGTLNGFFADLSAHLETELNDNAVTDLMIRCHPQTLGCMVADGRLPRG